ncbi:hypothetical protein BKA67DRAFT_581912 [Truncatella angustata]|uniref:Uncharacterized protein n=1 Tax=Truncatella angustata TaxID=152316 RepID=A0A9P8RJU7_9PEZI|nr:uncharacterized protein BKA67DRAFT_581912 [Truncatella angustata]KAH6647187.1 hypothetical protein BKA67DRAFT_581912 [Truncatella angustata]
MARTRASSYANDDPVTSGYRYRPLPSTPQVSENYRNKPLPLRPGEGQVPRTGDSPYPAPLHLPGRSHHRAPSHRPEVRRAPFDYSYVGFAEPVPRWPDNPRPYATEPVFVERSTTADYGGARHTYYEGRPYPAVSAQASCSYPDQGSSCYDEQDQGSSCYNDDDEWIQEVPRRANSVGVAKSAPSDCLLWGRYAGAWGDLQDEFAMLRLSNDTWQRAMHAFAGIHTDYITVGNSQLVTTHFATLRSILKPYWGETKTERWINSLASLANSPTLSIFESSDSDYDSEVQKSRGKNIAWAVGSVGSAVSGLIRKLSTRSRPKGSRRQSRKRSTAPSTSSYYG